MRKCFQKRLFLYSLAAHNMFRSIKITLIVIACKRFVYYPYSNEHKKSAPQAYDIIASAQIREAMFFMARNESTDEDSILKRDSLFWWCILVFVCRRYQAYIYHIQPEADNHQFISVAALPRINMQSILPPNNKSLMSHHI